MAKKMLGKVVAGAALGGASSWCSRRGSRSRTATRRRRARSTPSRTSSRLARGQAPRDLPGSAGARVRVVQGHRQGQAQAGRRRPGRGPRVARGGELLATTTRARTSTARTTGRHRARKRQGRARQGRQGQGRQGQGPRGQGRARQGRRRQGRRRQGQAAAAPPTDGQPGGQGGGAAADAYGDEGSKDWKGEEHGQDAEDGRDKKDWDSKDEDKKDWESKDEHGSARRLGQGLGDQGRARLASTARTRAGRTRTSTAPTSTARTRAGRTRTSTAPEDGSDKGWENKDEHGRRAWRYGKDEAARTSATGTGARVRLLRRGQGRQGRQAGSLRAQGLLRRGRARRAAARRGRRW